MSFTGGTQQFFPFAPGIGAVTAPGAVTSVTATLPIISSGGTTPNISLQIPLPIVDGGTGTSTPALIAGANVTITGAWPDQTISSTGGGSGGVASVTASSPLSSSGGSNPNISIISPLPVANGGTGSISPSGVIAGTNVTVSGTFPNQTVNATGGGGSVTAVTGSGNIISSGGTAPNITTVNNPTFTSVTATAAVSSNTLAVTASASVGTNLTVGASISAGTLVNSPLFESLSGNGVLGVFNVKDFGATGNGVTDDTAVIQTVCTSAAAVPSGTVYFPSGTYLVSSTITRAQGVSLVGASSNSSIIQSATNSLTMFSTIGTSTQSPEGSISSLTFGANAATTGNTAISTEFGFYLLVSNCNFLNTSVTFDRAIGHKVSNCTFAGQPTGGKAGQLTVWSSSDSTYTFDCVISNVVWQNTGGGTQSNAIYIRRGIGVLISNCCVNDMRTGNGTDGTFILFENDCQGSKASSCIVAAGLQGYKFQQGAGIAVFPTFCTLVNCDADQCRTAGVNILQGSGLTIIGGNLTASGVFTGSAAVNISNASSLVVLSGIVAYGFSTGNAFNFVGTSNNIILSDCIIGANANGVSLGASVTNVDIASNQLINNNAGIIAAAHIQGLVISGNTYPGTSTPYAITGDTAGVKYDTFTVAGQITAGSSTITIAYNPFPNGVLSCILTDITTPGYINLNSAAFNNGSFAANVTSGHLYAYGITGY